MPRIAESARRVKESRIRRLTIEAIAHKAVNLAQAFPDYAPPDAFVAAVERAAARAERHQYTDTWGSREARQAAADYIVRFHPGAVIDPNRNLLITIGAMEAMNDALLTVLDPGDEAIVLEPFYECFVAQILSRHGRPRYVPLAREAGRFAVDVEAIDRATTQHTRAIILSNPGNPHGTVHTRTEMERLLDLCRSRGTWLISDETYEQIYFTPDRPVSVADIDPTFTHSVLLSGFGKSFAVTGWRLGYLVGNEEFIRHVRPAHDVNTICAVSFVQDALPALTTVPDDYFETLRREYALRRDVLREGLESCGFGLSRVEGAYYLFAEIPEWWTGTGSELNDALIGGGFVAGVPGDVFFGPDDRGQRYIRYTFCKRTETLNVAVARLQSGLELLRAGSAPVQMG